MHEEESAFRRYLGYVAAIVGILGITVPAAVWAVNHFTSPAPAAHGDPAPAGTGTAPPRTTPPESATTAPATARVPLLDLPIDTGAGVQGTLPHALDGNAAYDRALVLGCPAGTVTDQNRSITFVLAGHYATFHADLRPYRSTSDESQVEYKLSPDSGTAPKFFVEVNGTATADLDVHDVRHLTVWITCTDPDAVAILTDAYVVHA